MKKIILALIFFILLSQVAFAYTGVGLRWGWEEAEVENFEEKCITYGIYNPFDVDVTARLVADGEIEDFVSRVEPEEIFVPAHTSSEDAIAIDICFTSPFDLFQKKYSGTVLAEYTTHKVNDMTGAAIGVSVQAPLTIYTAGIGLITSSVISIIIVLIIAVLFLSRKKIVKK